MEDERGGNLQHVRHAVDIGARVGTGGVKERRVEEHAISLFKRHLDTGLFEECPKVIAPPSRVTGAKFLGEWQELGWAAFNRHIAMGDSALERQDQRQVVDMGRIGGADLGGLKPEMIVAVCLLCSASGVNKVHLRGHLVMGPSHASQTAAIEVLAK